MNVLISQRHAINSNTQWCDSLENDYLGCFASFGITLFPVPNRPDCLPQVIETVRPLGIVLSGGGDVSPLFCAGGGAAVPEMSLVRDKLEEALLDHALKGRIPVLGICRGLQFINVYFGGTLVRDLNRLDSGAAHPCPGRHPVSIQYEELVVAAGIGDQVEVNSYHRQGVVGSGLATELRVFAQESELAVVEGIYHPAHRLAAVQWHPERSVEPAALDRTLIEAFRDGGLFWR